MYVPIVPVRGGAVVPATAPVVRMAVSGRQVVFQFNRLLVADLGWMPGDRIQLGFGVGADAGRLEVHRVPGTHAGHKLTPHNRRGLSTRVTLPAEIGGLSREAIMAGLPEGSVTLAHEVERGALRLHLPRLRLKVVAGTPVSA